MRALIVNADDYGLTPSVSAGIRQAHQQGVVTSTTAMLNLPGVEAELARALTECPDLGLGVHLVLTKGRPALPPSTVPSLSRLSGSEDFPTLAQLLAGLSEVDAAEVEAEWHAQIEAFVRVTGRAPTHLDSHHHAAYLAPPLLETLLGLAREFRCAVRWPLSAHDPEQRHLGIPAGQQAHLHDLAAASVRRPEHFEARFYGDGATVDLLQALLAELPAGVTELMCHPGLADDTLAGITSYHRHRAQELAALTHPALRLACAATGIALVTFGALASTSD